MTDTRFTDAAPILGARRTKDGYLVVEAFVAREGVQLYRGSEVGRPERDVVRVWRPRDEVMAPESVRTYSHATVTMGHPAEFVTSDTWAALAKGEVSTEAEWRDGKLRLPLIVKDGAAIAAIEAGTRELSAGYTTALDWTEGATPEGEAYDAVQRNIRINHVALVPAGRAGSDCRIGDGADPWGASPVTTSDEEGHMADTLTTLVLGDKAVQVAATDAPAIEAFKATQTKALADAKADHAREIAAKDAALAKAEAERDAARAAVLGDDALDARVAARAALIETAKRIAPEVKPAGLSDAALRKAVATARLGDAAAGKSDAYIDARFDILAEDAANPDPVADALRDGAPRKIVTLDQAYAARDIALAQAWMQPARKEA